MRTRTLISVIATAVVSAAIFGALNVAAQNQPETQTTPERCALPKGSGFRATVVSNTEGRIWYKETVRGNTVHRKFYVCVNHRRKHVYFGGTHHQDLVDEGDTPPFSRLGFGERSFDGSAIAFTKIDCNPAGENAKCNHLLRWVRLRDGKILREIRSSGAERPESPIVSGDSLLFYIVDTDNSTGPECGATPCEVRMAGVQGDKTLDSGSSISGLAFAGLTVYWKNENDVRAYDFLNSPPAVID